MTRGVPVLDPKVHLKGATPEKLARALLRNPHRPKKKGGSLRPRPGSAARSTAERSTDSESG